MKSCLQPALFCSTSIGAGALVLLLSLMPVGPAAFGQDSRSYHPAVLWAEPIEDALRIGETSFPEGFNRSISTLHVFDGLMWIGYGDSARNLGTVTPVEFRWMRSPDDPSPRSSRVIALDLGGVQRTESDTGEEQIDPYRICFGKLCQAGRDSNSADEAWTQQRVPGKLIEGNFFSLEMENGLPCWHKSRSIPGGEHVHDLAEFQGAIYAVGSGADNRAEFDVGKVFRYVWKSTDKGKTFTTVHRVMFPEPGKGDTRFRRLLVVGDCLYLFGYVYPFADGGTEEGRHLRIINGALSDLDDEIARLHVERTYSLTSDRGVVITGSVNNRTRAFEATQTGFREISAWNSLRVIDMAINFEASEVLLLSGNGETPETFAIHSARFATLDELLPVLELGTETPSAIALWDGAIFVGTANGKILKAEPKE